MLYLLVDRELQMYFSFNNRLLFVAVPNQSPSPTALTTLGVSGQSTCRPVGIQILCSFILKSFCYLCVDSFQRSGKSDVT